MIKGWQVCGDGERHSGRYVCSRNSGVHVRGRLKEGGGEGGERQKIGRASCRERV